MVKSLSFHCKRQGSIPSQGTKIPHASWPKKKKKILNREWVVCLDFFKLKDN